MGNLQYFTQKYIDWVIRLGRIRFSLLGIAILAAFALCIQILMSVFIVGKIYWIDIIRSISFGLISAPFVIYFFTKLVEKLENSRRELENSVIELRNEVSERVLAQEKLSIALEKLARINREKTTLLATISHELRTPLNGIIGLSRILMDENLTAQQHSYLKTIYISAVSLGHIFSDIIDLEKIDASHIKLVNAPVDVYSFLNDINNFSSLMAEQKHLKFSLVLPIDLPDWLEFDRVRLNQILWNLISNAVKFTEKGQITLEVKQCDNEVYQFIVTDSGSGIPTEELDRVFMLYYQVKENNKNTQGSGIGLAISKNLAHLMGGDLVVESQLGKGSSFTLFIKAKKSHPEESLVSNQVTSLSILLVEDIELNIIVAKAALEKLGHHVDVAMRGEEAIKLFEKNAYDFILLDIQLPDMTGFDVAKYLRTNYEEGIYDFLPPLIAFTANVMQSLEEYKRQGMDGVLRKPLSLNELIQCLNSYFDESSLISNSPSDLCLNKRDNVIDLSLLTLVGKQNFLANLKLFEETMPIYLSELRAAYEAYRLNKMVPLKLTQIVHKIKGAAGSAGLISVQLAVNKLQKSIENRNLESLSEQLIVLEQQWTNSVREAEWHTRKTP